MAFDIDDLVNKAVVDIFGEDPVTAPILFQPIVSDPESEPYAIKGIFDRDYTAIFTAVAHSEEHAAGVTTTKPMLSVRLAQFRKEPRQNDIVTVRGDTYKVFDIQPDALGMADLVLKEWDEALDDADL